MFMFQSKKSAVLKTMILRGLYLQKYAPRITQTHKSYQAVTFAGYEYISTNILGSSKPYINDIFL